MYVSIICIPQLFSEGSYIYPYNDESIITKIKNELNNYWNKIINLSLVDYPLIGIYFRIYYDVKLKYMKLNNSSSLSSAPLSLTSSLLTSNSTSKNFNKFIQSSSSLSHLPSSFLPPSQPSSSSSQESIRLYQVFFNFYLYWPNENLFIFATFILSCSIWIATGSLLVLHIYLIFIGKTTIEYINSFHSSTSTTSSKSYSSNIRAVENGGGSSSNGYLDGCFCRIFDTSCSNSNSSINHHHHRHNHHRSHHRHIHSGQQRTSYRRMKDNFIQIFGNVPWYLTLLPSIRQPPIIDSVMITMNKKNDDDDDENNNNEFKL